MPPVKRTAAKAAPAKATPAKKTVARKVAAPKKVEPPKLDRRKQTALVAASINRNKKFGPETVIVASKIVVPERWTTGALAFDVAMSGGLPVNQWVEVLGLENSGKTTFTLKAVAANQARDKDFFCVWIASENFDPSLAAIAGVDLERVLVVEENVMEYAFEIVLEFLEERGCDMVVIDSYPALVTMAEDGKDMEGFSPGRGAQLLNQFMRKATKASKRSLTDLGDRPFTAIIINQWREKIGVLHGDPRTSSGGKGKNYWMYARLDVKRDEWIVDGKSGPKVGQAIKIVCIKMKGARPQQVGVVDFYFADHGDFKAGEYDYFKQILSLGTLFDLIERSGSGYRGPNGEFIKSGAQLYETLMSDLEWRERLEREVLEASKRGKAPFEPDLDEELVELLEEEAEPKKPRRRRTTL